MMNDFVWPSDRDRAENDELNRVCEYAEQLFDELEAARAQGDAEPVAWIKETATSTTYAAGCAFSLSGDAHKRGWRPLIYGDTHPQPAQQASVPEGVCPRCKGKGRHVIGSANCPAIKVCQLCYATPHPEGDAEPTPEQMFDHYMRTAIANAPEPVQKLGEYLTSRLDEDNWPEAERLLNQICAQSVGVTEPDMFWDADDAEQFGGCDEQEFADNIGCDLLVGQSMAVRVQCAFQLPDRWMKVSAPDEPTTNWEWIDPPKQEGESGVCDWCGKPYPNDALQHETSAGDAICDWCAMLASVPGKAENAGGEQ